MMTMVAAAIAPPPSHIGGVVAYPYIDLGNLPNRAMLYRYS